METFPFGNSGRWRLQLHWRVGNTVILKPANGGLCLWLGNFAKCFLGGRVFQKIRYKWCVQMVREPLNYLTSHPSIRHTILTGGTDTAFRLLEK